MKTAPAKLRQFIAIGALAFVVSTSPAWAQQETNLNQPVPPQQTTGTRVNAPAPSPEEQLEQETREAREEQRILDQMQRDVARTGPFVDEPAGAGPLARNWSWLGLLGLFGLLGLRRREDAYEQEYRPVSPK